MEYWLLVVPTIIALSLHVEYISVLTSLEHDVVEYNMMEKWLLIFMPSEPHDEYS